jgi:molybdopterin/thiamine biosynthesis adenylyltransferase
MRAELRLTAEQFNRLHQHLLPDNAEHAAVLLCGIAAAGRLLLCHRVIPLTDADLESTSGRLHLDVSPLALARIAKQAASINCTLVVCHSHPFRGPVAASRVDLATENELCGRVLPGRLAGRPVGALILGPDGHDGRVWVDNKPRPLSITIDGVAQRQVDLTSMAAEERDARQLLVWGADGQERLRAARVAVVGCGGTGSHVTMQLAHLGIGRLMLIDPDIVEESNLSRLLGATAEDVGRSKVEVLAAAATQVRPSLSIDRVAASILDMDVTSLACSDVIVCCTDTHGARALLTELAAQYLVPLVELGIEVQSAGNGSRAGGGVRVIRPGGPCLHCVGIIDPALVRQDFLTDAQRRAEAKRGYLRDATDPAPSVVSLNGVVASLAVVEVLDQLLGLFRGKPTRLLYRAEARAVTTAETVSDPRCFVCGPDGLLGLGDARGLPRRPEPRTGSA